MSPYEAILNLLTSLKIGAQWVKPSCRHLKDLDIYYVFIFAEKVSPPPPPPVSVAYRVL